MRALTRARSGQPGSAAAVSLVGIRNRGPACSNLAIPLQCTIWPPLAAPWASHQVATTPILGHDGMGACHSRDPKLEGGRQLSPIHPPALDKRPSLIFSPSTPSSPASNNSDGWPMTTPVVSNVHVQCRIPVRSLSRAQPSLSVYSAVCAGLRRV